MTHLSAQSYIAPGFEAVGEAFEENFTEHGELGAGFAAYMDGDCLIDLKGGYADRAAKQPWTEETLVAVYSVTKGVSALIVAYLIDQGQLAYETPVAEYWPEFGVEGKDKITLAEVLSHQGGLPGFAEPIDPALWLEPERLAAKLAALAPLWPPGSGSGYHPTSWGYMVGEIVRRVSGRSLGHILHEDICAPLGIDFYIGLPTSEHARCADLKRPGAMPDLGEISAEARIAFLTKWASAPRNTAKWREIEIPSANGHGTAKALAQLYAAYATMGKLNGMRLFSKATWEALTRQRCAGPDRVLPFDMSFGAGIMRNNNLAFGPHPGALGHSGWGGSAALADPDRGLSAAYVMNRQSNILLGDPRSKRLFASLYACL